MTIENTTELARQAFFQDRISEAKGLEPNVETLACLDEGIINVANYLDEEKPEQVITLGRSSILSRILIMKSFKGRKKNFTSTALDGNENQLLYKMGYPEELSEEVRMKQLTRLFSSKYELLPRNKKIVVVDDFIHSGSKAVEVLSRLHQLGFSKIKWACFTSGADVDFRSNQYLEKLYKENERFPAFEHTFKKVREGSLGINLGEDIFIGSKNQIAHQYLRKLAELISLTKVSVFEYPKEMNDGSIKQKLTQEVVKVLRTIATYSSSA